MALPSLIAHFDAAKDCTTLSLSYGQIGDEGCMAIADFMRKNVVLKSMDLRGNNIREDGLVVLAHALRSTSIEKVDLRGNNLGIEGGKALLESLEENHSLLECNIFATGVPEETTDAIVMLLNRNAKEKEAFQSWDRRRKGNGLKEVPPAIAAARKAASAKKYNQKEMQKEKPRLDALDAGLQHAKDSRMSTASTEAPSEGDNSGTEYMLETVRMELAAEKGARREEAEAARGKVAAATAAMQTVRTALAAEKGARREEVAAATAAMQTVRGALAEVKGALAAEKRKRTEEAEAGSKRQKVLEAKVEELEAGRWW